MRKNKKSNLSEASGRLGEHTDFSAKEAYKIIRTNLLFTLASASNNVLMVSSAESAAGKSLTCANLSISMAQTGKHVLLVDADLRKPVQHRIFELTNSDGLSTMLSGSADAEKAIIHYHETTLDVLTSGPIPPNPVELLSSQKMSDLLKDLSGKYDYVFVDVPPINILSDGLVLASQVGGLILIARQNMTTYGGLQKAIDSVKQVKGVILGVIVNDVRERNKPYGSYYYGSYYGSYDKPSNK